MTAELEGEHVWHFVFGRSDANDRFVGLYHDPRPRSRLFEMKFANGRWTLERTRSDFHQRFVTEIGADRIDSHWGATTRAKRGGRTSTSSRAGPGSGRESAVVL
jgi:hypothetical protein